MLSYKYIARDPATGQKIKAEVQADSEKSAAELIRKLGYAPLSIKIKQENNGPLSHFRNRIKTKEKIIFSRQLATLINAGLPLVQSLRSVLSQTKSKPLQAVISKIVSDIEAGTNFSVALAAHPTVFNNIFINLVASGEASGTLDKTLDRLAIQQEKDAEIISKVRGAMVYPIIVLLVMGAVVSFMIIKVLPQVETLYKDISGARLPFITRILLSVSHALTKYWWVVLILAIVVGIFTSRWARTMGGRRIIDKAKMRTPPFGRLFMKVYMARFSRTGYTLISSGVPLLQTLEIASKAVDNYYIEQSLKSAMEKVKGGKALSDSLQGDPNFLELVPNMIRIGEQSGSLEGMLSKTADYYEKEVDDEIKTISTIIEPLMMILLGVVALIIVAAVLLPIYGLAGLSGFGG